MVGIIPWSGALLKVNTCTILFWVIYGNTELGIRGSFCTQVYMGFAVPE
jgi:hypothetical protein